MSYRFSSRTGWDLRESSFAESIRKAKSEGRDLVDLTVSNPTVCGFIYDHDAVLAPLSDSRALTYDPDPRGMLSAREAVAGYYVDHGAQVSPGALLLTTSTSEAYGYLFRLLCDAGDEILVAQPSYPLFDFLADLEDVRLRPYPLFYDYGWWIDFAELERRIGPKTRAIVLVHPNNPTGHGTGREERTRLEEICSRRGLAMIVDEVFLDYPLGKRKIESFACGPHPVLTFILSGMSKIAGLPQMKVGWIAAFGPDAGREAALARLEVIADTFLSMNAPAQLALPLWLQSRFPLQKQILERTSANLNAIRDNGLQVLHTDAGWSAVVRLRSVGITPEGLLSEDAVVVHPGSFYGMPEPERIVVSLITPRVALSEGVRRIAAAGGANPQSPFSTS
ncbi:pyridoxal phosphate-dependent aminotransferase [Edaphobacter sp. 12200R-103]|uniref:pyridoxal phosphate-dependent aminotransferase n=1 Tax=Edaphobacter sp. 12200R-103 TaxID=2703788 RepID=UPI00138C8ED3|nr:pyridoxal phosphate-dependent aminotransferase [Edaphobacter sp. 12200R-103]QHS51256.1 pyridoxal phosphate-dependent aminotransferase [Edaphobacter sp. 12200R-103]